jgi:uncharacterized membrane protein YvbJ
MRPCKTCGKNLSVETKTCPHCGQPDPTSTNMRPCKTCGKNLSVETKTCPHCGQPDPTSTNIENEKPKTEQRSVKKGSNLGYRVGCYSAFFLFLIFFLVLVFIFYPYL